jgi:aryl-alcohol dehydrogenase-like predicted oxidoreductase
METRTLGKAALAVPVIGMGTWQTLDVRGARAEANARTIVDHALDAGARFFDSSPMYGEAERVLGHALDGRREAALVATKVWASTVAQGVHKSNGRSRSSAGGSISIRFTIS